MVTRIFRNLFQNQWIPVYTTLHRCCGHTTVIQNKLPNELDIRKETSLLEPINNSDDSDLPGWSLKPAFNLAAYVNKSDTLQQLIKLGVDLSRVERKKPDLAQYLLGLNFEQQIQPHLLLLHDLGIVPEELGKYLTKNPAILKESLEDLEVRVNYLSSKRFKKADIQRIVSKNPFWLMFSTPRIDARLGFFQRQFFLTGKETRMLAVGHPRLITYSIEHVRRASFTVAEEMGMTKEETKQLILKLPKILTLDHFKTVEKFDFLHNKMKIPHDQLIDEPLVFLSRQHRLEQRHKFLHHLGKAQYDKSKPLYTSLSTLVSGSDQEFVMNVARSTLGEYETFLKTL